MSKTEKENIAEAEAENKTAEEQIDEEAAADEKTEEKKEKKDKKPKKQKDNESDKLKKELESQKDIYLRLAAEYDNYRKRTTNEKAAIYSDATARAVTEILSVADSLEMAVKSAENAPEEFKKGIELVAAQMENALTKLNVEKFCEIGDEFNPELHNAVSRIDDENLGENVVSQVLQRGYKIGDKIIRHAMVQVANCD